MKNWFCSRKLRVDELLVFLRSSHRKCSIKKGILINFANFTGKHLYWSLFLIKLHAFWCSCEICKIFKNTSFEEHLRTTASDSYKTKGYNFSGITVALDNFA